MVKIGFEDVGKYDKATFVCLQHSDCRDKTPEVCARCNSKKLPGPCVPIKIFTSCEIPALKKKDKDLMEFLKWIAETRLE